MEADELRIEYEVSDSILLLHPSYYCHHQTRVLSHILNKYNIEDEDDEEEEVNKGTGKGIFRII